MPHSPKLHSAMCVLAARVEAVGGQRAGVPCKREAVILPERGYPPLAIGQATRSRAWRFLAHALKSRRADPISISGPARSINSGAQGRIVINQGRFFLNQIGRAH